MKINIILLLFVIILGLLMSSKDNGRNRKTYIVVCSFVLILVAALRSPEWMSYQYGIDTLSYKQVFESTYKMSWGELWDTFNERYIIGGTSDEDIGYDVFMKIIGSLTHSFYIFSIVMDLFFFIPFGIILYRFSDKMQQLIFAFVFYIALIQVFLIGGARQILSIGLDLFAFLAVLDRKKWKAIVFFMLGLTVHFSSLLFAIPLLLLWFNVPEKLLKRAHLIFFIMFPVAWIFANEIIVWMGEASGVERYAQYGTGTMANDANVFVLLLEFLSLFCFLAIKEKDLLKNQSYKNLYTMTPFFTFFAPLIQSNGSMIRISLYYHLFLVLLVPYAIDCMFDVKNRNLIYYIAIIVLAILTYSGSTEYYFFWQITNYYG